MSLDGLLLEKLARWRPDGRQTLEISDPESGWSAGVTADAVDVVGCRLWEVTLRHAGSAIPTGDLKTRADHVAGKVTGLLEPLRVVEVDEGRGEALLRSATPGRRGDAVCYSEVLLHIGGAASVRRFEGPHGEERRRLQVAYSLTHEALGRIVADLMR